MSSNRWKKKQGGGRATNYYDHHHHDDRTDSSSYNNRSSGVGDEGGGGGGREYHSVRVPRGAYRGRVRGRGRGGSRGRRGGSYHYSKSNDNDGYQKGAAGAAPSADLDGDIDMEGGAGGGEDQRFNPYKRPSNRGTSRGGGKHTSRPSHSQARAGQSMQWFRISVYNGAADGEEEIMRKMQELSFKKIPYRQFYTEGDHAFFYIRGSTEAREVASFSKKIESITGEKLVMISRRSSMDPFSDAQMLTLQQVLMSRFDTASGHLNLSRMYHDTAIRELDMPLKVKFTEHMTLVLQVLRKLITEMKANEIVSLNFADNQLTKMDGVKYFVEFAPNVKTLDLSKNFVRDIRELNKIKDWNVKSISLDENPLCELERYGSLSDYISDARDVFPDLEKLDSKDLPPTVKFDSADQKLPSALGSNITLLPNDGARAVVGAFITKFFNSYDGNRSALRPAYDTDSIFSLSIPGTPRGAPLNNYYTYARNLQKQKKKADLVAKAMCGIDKIMDIQRKMPATCHFIDSFVVDVTFCLEKMVAFVVHGLFQEGTNTGSRPRAFTRNFVCRVEPTPELVILNDELHVRNSTVAEQKAFAEQKAAKAKAAVAPTPVAPTQVVASVATLTPAAKEEMLLRFCTESKMVKDFSLQCLEANGWNFEKAGANFLELYKSNAIPPAAFQNSS